MLTVIIYFCFRFRNVEAISQYKQGVGKFVAKEKGLLYVSIQDPIEHLSHGYNEKDTISVWTRHGRIKVSSFTIQCFEF